MTTSTDQIKSIFKAALKAHLNLGDVTVFDDRGKTVSDYTLEAIRAAIVKKKFRPYTPTQDDDGLVYSFNVKGETFDSRYGKSFSVPILGGTYYSEMEFLWNIDRGKKSSESYGERRFEEQVE